MTQLATNLYPKKFGPLGFNRSEGQITLSGIANLLLSNLSYCLWLCSDCFCFVRVIVIFDPHQWSRMRVGRGATFVQKPNTRKSLFAAAVTASAPALRWMDFITSFDIRLEKDVYYAGETIVGCVVLENSEPIKIRGNTILIS